MNAYLNTHLLDCYIKSTNATNCEIKMYTGLLQKHLIFYFQYKIINRIINCNKKLFDMKIKNSPVC